ncbi:MAG: hypothetical protein QOG62_1712 [Thermoleophilaceae bacterium]|nr:hypothetical protein [Thermoleophilaceae bacterium]
MTTDRLFSDHLHSAKDRPRILVTALVLVIAALLSVPSGVLADEYIPSGGEGGNHGGGGTPKDSGSFSVPGAPKGDTGEPAPVETTETPVAPTGPTPEQIAAEKQARKDAKEKKARLEAKKAAKKAKQEQKQLEKEAAAAAQTETPEGTQTAADVARTAFEGDDAGPLPIVLGVLLLITGIGLVIRYRRTGRSS